MGEAAAAAAVASASAGAVGAVAAAAAKEALTPGEAALREQLLQPQWYSVSPAKLVRDCKFADRAELERVAQALAAKSGDQAPPPRPRPAPPPHSQTRGRA